MDAEAKIRKVRLRGIKDKEQKYDLFAYVSALVLGQGANHTPSGNRVELSIAMRMYFEHAAHAPL